MKVFVSNHQNLEEVSKVSGHSAPYGPFSMRVFAHRVPNRIDFLPAFSPFVSVAFLRAHVYNLQLVSPIMCVLLLVLDAVPLDSPLARPFPLHDTPSLVCSKNHDVFASAAKEG
jgi:hypothetical protein